jgi:short-subunit dehydrogenase
VVSASRAAIVTGASGGIGLGIAKALAEEGYAVTMSARRPDKLEAATAALADAGHDVAAVPADVSRPQDLELLVTTHLRRYGRLDVLVNNAGIGIGGPLASATDKSIDLQLNVNLRSAMLLVRACISALREAGTAQVINVASLTGLRPEPGLAVYSATKAGLIAFTEALNREYNVDGIRATALCPGLVDTAMADGYSEVVPKEEMLTVGDIVESVRFLLRTSPQCIVPAIPFARPGSIL